MNESAMRAAVVTGPGQIKIDRVPVPVPSAGEVRVRLEGCGVCASNLALWGGMPWSQYPTAPGALGHEGWGVIDALGEQVEHLEVGERVAALSHHSYAEYDIAAADAVVPLPRSMKPGPFPGEAMGCAINIFRRARIRSGDVVAIVGVGFLGALLTKLAAEQGARVIALSRRQFALDLARRMGADAVIEQHDHQRVLSQVSDMTQGSLCDVVIEAVGKQQPLDLAAELTRERGRLVIAGYHQDGPRQVNMQLWNWRGLDVVNAHERALGAYVQGVRGAIDAVERGLWDPAALCTHAFPLERLSDALDATRDRPKGFLKAFVTM